MGGKGSGRPTKEDSILRSMNKPMPAKISEVSEGYDIPNLSGMGSNQDATNWLGNNYVKIDGSNLADESSADTIYVAGVLYGTDDTPPTASGFPIGTIYIQYTA